jgi:hypothetical protein
MHQATRSNRVRECAGSFRSPALPSRAARFGRTKRRMGSSLHCRRSEYAQRAQILRSTTLQIVVFLRAYSLQRKGTKSAKSKSRALHCKRSIFAPCANFRSMGPWPVLAATGRGPMLRWVAAGSRAVSFVSLRCKENVARPLVAALPRKDRPQRNGESAESTRAVCMA